MFMTLEGKSLDSSGSPLLVQSQDKAHGSSAFLVGAMLGGDLNSANGACPSPVGECSCLPQGGRGGKWQRLSRMHQKIFRPLHYFGVYSSDLVRRDVGLKNVRQAEDGFIFIVLLKWKGQSAHTHTPLFFIFFIF